MASVRRAEGSFITAPGGTVGYGLAELGKKLDNWGKNVKMPEGYQIIEPQWNTLMIDVEDLQPTGERVFWWAMDFKVKWTGK